MRQSNAEPVPAAVPSDLEWLVRVWPELTPEVREAVIKLVRAVRQCS